MSARVVKVEEFPKVFKRYNKKLLGIYKVAAERGIINSIPHLVQESPVDTGEYSKSWDYEKTKDAIKVGNFAPHAAIIEFGARPFKPPIKPLLAWAKRVLKDDSQPPEYSPEVWQLALGTQRKIQEKGMEPKHIMSKNLDYIKDQMREELKQLKLEEAKRGL